MYKIDAVRSIHLEVTSKCQARCPMCIRRINGGPLNPYIELNEITLDQFQRWFAVDFVKQLNHLSMCGNLGDPIVANDTLEIFRYLRTNNSSMILNMYTNGSARTDEWFVELARLNVVVIFGIDGLEDTHHLHRVDTSWSKIIDNAKYFIEAGGHARWDMLVFQHNEHQVDACRELSKEMGFKEFFSKNTSRFSAGKLEVRSTDNKTTHVIYPTTKSSDMIEKVAQAEQVTLPTITCKSKRDNQMYVAANGTVTPCCWLDLQNVPPSNLNQKQYLDTVGYWPNLNQQTLEEIFNSGYFNKIETSWSTTGIKECSKQCGTFDRLAEQFSR
jgi:MoaA/NifB/PqqE/SkfB family radical SAM enzyme